MLTIPTLVKKEETQHSCLILNGQEDNQLGQWRVLYNITINIIINSLCFRI